MIETLFCENGQHNWERESKRGKKPKNCPNHGDLVKSPLAPKSVTVSCSNCGGDGIDPDIGAHRRCRACGGSGKITRELNEAGERKLICQHDEHEWWAPVQRGRPPRFCPEHRPDKPQFKTHVAEYEARETSQDIINKSHLASSMRELYCHAGNHTYQTERKRGKPPRNCPEHSEIGAVERKGELVQEKKEKAQKLLQDEIARLCARVDEAEIVDRDAMSKLQAAGGVNKAEEEFKAWLRANTALLHEVEALRARERKLVEL